MEKRELLGIIICSQILFLIYLANGITTQYSWDTIPTMIIPWGIIQHQTLTLDPYVDFFHAFNSWYFVVSSHGQLVSFYPIVTAILALPFYIPIYIFLKIIDVEITQNFDIFWSVTMISQKLTAMILTIACIVVFYLVLRRLTDKKWAFITAITLALCTNMWVISSQGLWQHGPGALFLSLIFYFIITDRNKPRKINLIILGVLSSLLFFNRPSDLPLLIPVLYYAIVRREPLFFASMGLIAIPFLAYGFYYFNSPIGGYSGLFAQFSISWFASHWVNAFLDFEHGLIIYTPIVLLAIPSIYLLVKENKDKTVHMLVILTLISLGLFSIELGLFSGSGAWGFGPRYWTETMPIFLLFIGLTKKELRMKTGYKIAFIALFTISLLFQIYGAFIFL